MLDRNRRFSHSAGAPLETAEKTYFEAGVGYGDPINITRFDVVINNRGDKRFQFNYNFIR